MLSSQDLHSDTVNSAKPSSELGSNSTQLQIHPLTLSEILTGAIPLAQSAGSSVCHKNKITKPKMPYAKPGNKTMIQWDCDDDGEGKTSMYLFLNWLTDEHNFSRSKNIKSENRAVAKEIEQYMIANGITSKKIGCLEDSWQKADGLCDQTGAGSWKTAQELKAVNSWADNITEWLSLEKVALNETRTPEHIPGLILCIP
ncbi:hypothetical protein DFH28DRAFT_1147928 [Melampsora americana]|nr:hypothetical protein DFH28DRAFT_1147928 [Melampsora americana]